MRFHVLGVGAVGTLVSFHLKRTARQLARAFAETDQSLHLPASTSASGSGSGSVQEIIPRNANTARNANFLQSLPYRRALQLLDRPDQIGVILQLQRDAFAKAVKQANYGMVVERAGVRQREKGFGYEVLEQRKDNSGRIYRQPVLLPADDSIDHLGTSFLETRNHPEGTIDALIVTTKANKTLAAIQNIAHRITSGSTIILLQNGQGVLDQLLQNVFQDPASRPNIILATTTHGAFTRNKHHSVHAASGRIELGIVPSVALGRSYERIVEPDVVEDDELRDANSDSSVPQQDTKGQGRPPRLNTGIGLLPRLDLEAIPRNDSTETLVQTMAMLLNLPLDVHWHPIRKYQLMSMRKLVVNACINPLTALVDCRNGELFENHYAEQTIRDVCREAHQILLALAARAYREGSKSRENMNKGITSASSRSGAHNHDRSMTTAISSREAQRLEQAQKVMSNPLSSPQDYLFVLSTSAGDSPVSGVPALDPSLSENALVQEVNRVIYLTAPNFSSMLQDIRKPRGETEIAFINGYLGRLGRVLGVPTPVNDTLTQMVQLKGSRMTSPSWSGPGGPTSR